MSRRSTCGMTTWSLLPGGVLCASAAKLAAASTVVRDALRKVLLFIGVCRLTDGPGRWFRTKMSEEEREPQRPRLVFGGTLVADERRVERVVAAHHESLGEVVAQADSRHRELGVRVLRADQALVREVLELADADAEEGRDAMVRPRLDQDVDVPQVGAREHALHLADRALDAQRVGEAIAGP